jgi:hypothetical protein
MEIHDKRKRIYEVFYHDFHDLNRENHLALARVIQDIFEEYDKIFLNGDVIQKLDKEDIRFKVFVTDDDKITQNKLTLVTNSYQDYNITFNLKLILKHSLEFKEFDYFQFFLLIIEHEFIHLITWLWDYTEEKKAEEIFRNHGKFFNCVAETLFGHQNMEHDMGYKSSKCDNDYLKKLSPNFVKMLTNAVIKKDIMHDYIEAEIIKNREEYFQKKKRDGREGICIMGIPENESHIIVHKMCKKYGLKCIVFTDVDDIDFLPYEFQNIIKIKIDDKKQKISLLENAAYKYSIDNFQKIDYLPIGPFDTSFERYFKPDIEYKHIDVLLDSELKYGSKIRGAKFFYDVKQQGYSEIVVAGSAEGYAQVTAPFCCNEVGLKCTIFIKKLYNRTDATRKGLKLGANIIEVPNQGYNNPVRMRDLNVMAQEYAKKDPKKIKYVEIGLRDEKFIDAVANNVVCLKEKYHLQPTEIWIIAGTGTIAAGISRAFPMIPIHLVKVGLDIWKENIDSIEKSSSQKPIIHVAPVKFHEKSPTPSPYKAHPNYDDKIWYFAKDFAKDGALIWIIA